MIRPARWLLVLGLALLAAAPLSGEEAAPAKPVELSPEKVEALQAAIKRLQSEQWAEREAAMKDLQAFGTGALPYLKGLSTEGHTELAWRIKKLIHLAHLSANAPLREKLAGLLDAYPDKTPAERAQIVIVMVRQVNHLCVPLLVQLLEGEDSPEVQLAIVQQMGRLKPYPQSLDPLLKLYAKAGDEVKGPVLWALANLATKEARHAARHALDGPPDTVRAWAVRSLVRMNDRESLPTLRKLAQGGPATSEDVREYALQALINMFDGEAGPIFEHALDGSPEVRELGLRGLAGLRYKPAAQTLIKLYGEDASEGIRDVILDTMGPMGAEAFIPVLKEALGKEPPSLRISAIRALEQMRVLKAGPAVAALLADQDDDVRRTAIKAVATLRFQPAVEALKKMFPAEEDASTRLSIAEALANLGDPEGEKQIVAMAGALDTRVGELAVSLVGEWHLESGLEALRARVESGRTEEMLLWSLFGVEHNELAFRQLVKKFMSDYLVDPTNTYRAMRLASVLEARGLNNRAASLMARVVKTQPNYSFALRRLASLYHKMGAYTECDQMFDRIRGVDGTDSNYYNNRAWFYCTSYRPEFLKAEESLSLVTRAVSLEPHSPHITDTMGWALHVNKQYDQAVEQLQRALDLKDPADKAGCAWQRTRLARSLWAAGQHDRALKEVATALDTAPFKDDVWFEAAGFYASIGRRDEAVHCLHSALDRGLIQVTDVELNPEFDALRDDPGYRFALEKVRQAQARVDRIVQEIEAETRRELNQAPPEKEDEGIHMFDDAGF